MKSLVFKLLFLLFINDAHVSSKFIEVPVILGDSVSLHTYASHIQSGSVLSWMFGEKDIARIHSAYNKTTVFVNNNNADRLELDRITGNLKIKNVKITDSGKYTLQNNNPGGRMTETFIVSVINRPSGGVNFVSVLERDSVILSPDLDEIQGDDQLTWKFEDMPIAHLNQTRGAAIEGRFEGKLQLNQKNGSLIITNVKLNNSGLYEVHISKAGRRFSTHKTFKLTVDADNRLSVMEGTSITLESGVATITKDDVLMWRCEHGDSVIVKITNMVFTIFNGADGRFKDKLELNHDTGSLTIRKIRMEHAGLYHLDIIGTERTRFKRINISVYPEVWPSHMLALIGVAFMLGLSSLVVVVICLYNNINNTKGNPMENGRPRGAC